MGEPSIAGALVALAAGLAGGLLSYWVLRHFPGKLRIRSLTFVGDDGRSRALLQLVDSDIMLLLTDANMSWRARLSVGDEGPFLHFLENEVNARVGIGILEDGSPGVQLANSDGTPQASLRLDSDGEVSLVLRDRKGAVRGSFNVAADGNPLLVLLDGNGRTLARLPPDNER